MEGPSFSNGAVFPPFRWAGTRGETSKRPRFTKTAQEPDFICNSERAVRPWRCTSGERPQRGETLRSRVRVPHAYRRLWDGFASKARIQEKINRFRALN